MLIIKTGMRSEFNVVQSMLKAKGHLDRVLVLKGIETFDRMNRSLPKCDGIISIGTCGGLSPIPQVGEGYVAGSLATPDGIFNTDTEWTQRLADLTGAKLTRWWSSGVFNTANDVASRQALFQKSNATIIDDESFDVARFAALRNIPFAIMRVVSDACVPDDDVPPAARNAVNANGGIDIFEVIKSLLHDYGQLPQLGRMWTHFNVAIAKLRLMLDQTGDDLINFR